METECSEDCLSRVSAFLSDTLGLHFPRERWNEMQRGIAAASDELFEGDLSRAMRWLAGAPALSDQQLEALAAHLTVAETYFFREPGHFTLLAERILPEILARGTRHLRLWSAGCCSGEEAYSIAIVLRRALPDWDRRQISIVATDLNSRALRKARSGIFGAWSFRDAPPWLKPGFFRATADGRFELLPEIRRMVQFETLNLVRDAYPSSPISADALDVVFCRNVLMYFSPAQARRVVERIGGAQRDGGWLIAGSSEVPHLSGLRYAAVSASGVVVFRKGTDPPSAVRGAPTATATIVAATVESNIIAAPMEAQLKSGPVPPKQAHPPALEDPREAARALYEQRRFAEAADALTKWITARPELPDASALALLARCLANQGRLDEALRRCDQAIAADKCDADTRYLRALILRELGATEAAMRALRGVLFLDQRFALAHVALATLAREHGRIGLAEKHLKLARIAIARLAPDTQLSEFESMTAGQLAQAIHANTHEDALP